MVLKQVLHENYLKDALDRMMGTQPQNLLFSRFGGGAYYLHFLRIHMWYNFKRGREEDTAGMGVPV